MFGDRTRRSGNLGGRRISNVLQQQTGVIIALNANPLRRELSLVGEPSFPIVAVVEDTDRNRGYQACKRDEQSEATVHPTKHRGPLEIVRTARARSKKRDSEPLDFVNQ